MVSCMTGGIRDSWGSRRVDNFTEKTLQAIESKCGVVASRRTREQIVTDICSISVFSEVTGCCITAAQQLRRLQRKQYPVVVLG